MQILWGTPWPGANGPGHESRKERSVSAGSDSSSTQRVVNKMMSQKEQKQ